MSDTPCPLCTATTTLTPWSVPAAQPPTELDLCATCLAQITGAVPLDAKHWNCLRESIWSEVPAVQAVSWRLLNRLSGVPWAVDLLDQVYLDDELLAWAQSGVEADAPAAVRTVDSNGAELSEGDSVTLVKDLDVKGAGFTAKRGTLVKNIRLTDDPGLIEGRVNGTIIVLKTAFLKRA